MKTTNERVENLKAKPALTKCLIGCIQNYKQQTKWEIEQLSKAPDVSYRLKHCGERIFEYDQRVYYAKKALGIIASQGFESLKPSLQNILVITASSRGNSTLDFANTLNKIEIKVIAELISNLSLHSI